MTSPESPQSEIDLYGFNTADMAQLPLGIFKQVRRLIGLLHQKNAIGPDQYHPSSISSDPSQRHYGPENRLNDYRPNHLGILGYGLGAVATDYANQLAKPEVLDPGARISSGYIAKDETLEGIPDEDTRPKID